MSHPSSAVQPPRRHARAACRVPGRRRRRSAGEKSAWVRTAGRVTVGEVDGADGDLAGHGRRECTRAGAGVTPGDTTQRTANL